LAAQTEQDSGAKDEEVIQPNISVGWVEGASSAL
jgi:hypothetical protein